MAGVPSVPRSRGIGVLALLALLLSGTPVAAADEQDTSAGVVLARGSISASLVADLDGDGANEVIAIVGPSDGEGPLEVQAWAEGEGGWSSLGSAPLQRWGNEGQPSRPANGNDVASLLLVETADGPRVFVPVAEANSDGFGACCLSFTTLGLDGDALRAELAPRLPGAIGAESLVAMDFDADGVDEVVVSEYVTDGDGNVEPRYSVLRQTMSSWRRQDLPIDEDRLMWLSTYGETDGLAGLELILLDAETSGLTRVFADGDELRAESAPEGELLGPSGGWIAGAADGVLLFAEERGISTAEWPRGGLPTRLRSVDASTFPSLFMLGDGPDARIVQLMDSGMERNVDLGLRIFDLDLNLLQSWTADPLVQELWELNQSGSSGLSEVSHRLWPLFGPLPTGLDGRPAMLGAGSLISVSPSGAVDIQPTRPVLGSSPVGMAGRDADWVVNGPGWYGLPSSVSLYGSGFPDSFLSVVPLDTLLDDAAGVASWSLEGATPLELDGEEVLATGGDGFTATVSGAPGTLVVTKVGARFSHDEIADGSLSVDIDPGGREDDENERVEASILVIEPTGVGTSETWQVDVYRQPPEVDVTTESELFSLRSTIHGSASDGVTVTVDGQPVELDADGTFSAEVDAPIWPRDVLVVATDPIGAQRTERLEVIGFVDYRGLPWIPIVGSLTAVAGMVLFVRTPRLRPDERLMPEGDGRLVEIDGDLI